MTRIVNVPAENTVCDRHEGMVIQNYESANINVKPKVNKRGLNEFARFFQVVAVRKLSC